MENRHQHAVIIGAGPAGLTAAWQLLKTMQQGMRVTVLEATGRIGGISTTIEYHGNRIDIGGHRFFSKNKQVNELWQELMPAQGKPAQDDRILGTKKDFSPNGPDPETSDGVMLIRDRVSRIFYRNRFFDYPIALKPATLLNMGLLNTLKSGCSYVFSALKKRPEHSLEDFYINRFGKQLYRMFFEDYTEKVWGIHPAELSAAWGAQRVKELSILGILKEALLKAINPQHKTRQTSLIERFFYPKFGPGQLWSILAERVQEMGGILRMNAEVVGIQSENNVITHVQISRDSGIETLPVDYLFSSMPIKDMVAAMDEKTMSAETRHIALNLPYRDFITVGLLVKKLTIKNQTKVRTINDIVPDCWIYIQEREVQLGRLQIFNNWSPYMVKDTDSVWIGLEYFCNEGDALWNMPEKDFIAFAIDELAKIKVIEKGDVLDANQVKIKKAYPAYFGAYDEIGKVRSWLDGFQNLFCIGRNGQHKYNNMDHSMLSALEAVAILQSGKLDKASLWEVNTEKEYHEGEGK
jgi:protoporphyrinogen oxidase